MPGFRWPMGACSVHAATNSKGANVIINRESVSSLDFDGLSILDYTAGLGSSSSLAHIRVPPGARHAPSWSTRSTKYYYVLSGPIHFGIDGDEFVLDQGDVCILFIGQRFTYENRSDTSVEMILVHTPSFNLEAERFEA